MIRNNSGANYYLVFRAGGSALVHIGLQAGDEVAEAVLFQGTITDISNGDPYGVVTVYSELGAHGSSWQAVLVLTLEIMERQMQRIGSG